MPKSGSARRERELSDLIAAVDPLSKRMEEFTQENANLAAQLEALSVDAAALQQQLAARQDELDALISTSADIHTLESQLVTVQTRATRQPPRSPILMPG